MRGMHDVKIKERPPVFGAFSVVLPLVGVPFAYFVTRPSEAGDGWGGAIQLVLIIGATLLSGFVSAVIGLARSEKYIGLSFLGLVLNLAPIVWVMTKH